MRRRPRLTLTAAALLLSAVFWLALVAAGAAFDAQWPETRAVWMEFFAVCALVTAAWMLCFVVLAGSERLGWLAVGIVGYLSGAIVLRLLELSAYLWRGRLTFDASAQRTLIAVIVLVSVGAVVARLMTPDPERLPSPRTTTVRLAAWLALIGLTAWTVWAAGRYL